MKVIHLFADFTGAKLEDRIVEFEELKSLLAQSSLIDETSIDLSRYYGDYSRYKQVSPRQRVEFCLDVFARALAIHNKVSFLLIGKKRERAKINQGLFSPFPILLQEVFKM
ncbi:MAG: hypothetical protein KI793_16620 [Rivularia sp. (in: Bacteria)]|nr:hypothetical protein [Rivularia sp. MS3]